MKKWLISIAITLLIPVSMRGEEGYAFRHLNVESGLPQNTVNCIFQDGQGFLWFGTKDGLSRYDGTSFHNFRHDKDDKHSIGNNFIRSIFQDYGQDELADIWVGTDAGVYIYHPSTKHFSRFDLQTADGISLDREVNDIKADKSGNIWFAADWQGVFLYRPQQKELIAYPMEAFAWCICLDREDNVWLGTHGKGLFCYNSEKDLFESVATTKGGETEADIYRLFQDNYNDLLIGTANGGVKKMNLITKKTEPLLTSEAGNRLFVRDIIRKSDTELCLATESGFYIYNTHNRTLKNLTHEPFDPYSLSDNAVYSLYIDREGGLWMGTYFGGINYYPPQHTHFERFYPQNKKDALHGKRVREFQRDHYGNFWIGTEDNGLNCYNPRTHTFKNFMPDGTPESIVYHNIHGLLADGDKLWVGTFTHGLNVIDIPSQKVIRHYTKTDDPQSLSENSVFSIYKDVSGNIWLGTTGGLALYNPQHDNFTRIEYTGNTFIYDIFQSYDGILWFASYSKGLFRYNPRTKEWKVFKHDASDKNSLAFDKVISVCEDSKKRLWLTTEGGGVCRYNSEDESFTSFSTKDGLPNDMVYKILEDDKGRLWLSTNKGLSCFNPDNGFIKTFTLDNGLLGDQFNYKSGYKSPNGKFYFGCLNGFIAFDPQAFARNEYVPPVVITNFPSKEIHLSYKQSSFSIDFAALSYVAPKKNKYACILEGFEDKWTLLEGKHSVAYSNIPPGNYVFRVKGTNNDDKWNETPTELAIIIHPPFYKTHLAYALYAFLLLISLVWASLFYKRRAHQLRDFRKVEQAFINSPTTTADSIARTKADEIFLGKVTEVIHKHLSDISFNVDVLADELHTSRSSLHRKIKGISELTPNDFIQLVRLTKAAELLKTGSYRINELYLLVGFGSSSYFSKKYKEQFGVSPRDIATRH